MSTRRNARDRGRPLQIPATALAAGPSSGIPEDVLQDLCLLQSLVHEVKQLRDLVHKKNREAHRISSDLKKKIKKLGIDFAAAEAAARGETIESRQENTE